VVREVEDFLARYTTGVILFVGHGTVGTLLFCKLSGLAISRKFDQSESGGCFFEFNTADCKPTWG